MPRQESENHDAAAFSLGLPPSSQNAPVRHQGWRDALSTAWVIGLVLFSLLCASLLADTTAFEGVAALFDRQALVWLEAIFGYLCIVGVSLNLRQQHTKPGAASASLLLSVLAFTSFSYHLLLLRWPWLTGEAEDDCRYAVWSAILSSTWRGVPTWAFGELLGIAVLLTHGFVGLSVSLPWQRLGRATPRVRVTLVAVGLVTYLLASGVIIALATGRR